MLSPEEKAARLAYGQGQMKLHELYAQLWTAKAQLPGSDHKECVRVALVHIGWFQECLDSQDKLIRNEVMS